MIRRSGATLVEVLVAIFIMAIGLLALLTLFPLGALSMARAIKDDRAATSASAGASLARTWQVHTDPNLLNWAGPGVPAYYPGGVWPPWPAPAAGSPTLPSYPVYVDPSGSASSPTIGRVVGFSPGIPRVSPSYVSAGLLSLQIAKWFTLPDDLNYAPDPFLGYAAAPPKLGVPVVGPPGNVQREGRYSWAYMLRSPNYLIPNVTELTVVVYSGRPSLLATGERTYSPVLFNHGTTNVDVTWGAGQEKPPVKPGSWILDATVTVAGAPQPYGFFYRVVGVSDTGAASVNIELQTPIRFSYPLAAGVAQPVSHTGVLVVMENVATVVEKGQVGVKEY